ncbi:MAG: hypothetical protein BZ133_03200 [Methanosphaera sp. SHI613]|jgi:catechol 2,3-dioxygenase-like lactoylglutathione lyase family enzyme|nr:MAG: hypothetical protein BZ133_03200 [Methanosphaera sp. SHI613]
MNIKYTSIKVKDISKSRDFYCKIMGLDIVDEYYSDNISVVMLSDGNMNLELIEDSSGEYGLNNIGFTVNDIDEIVERFKKYGISYKENLLGKDNCIISLTDCDGVDVNVINK